MAYTQMQNDVYIASIPAVTNENARAIQQDRIVDAGKVNGLTTGNATGNIPVANGTICTNLNAEKLGGNLASAFATAAHTHTVVTTSSDGIMLATDKVKINGIATGAEVNQNAFSNVLVGGVTIASDSKTDTLEIVAGSGITLTPDTTNDKLTIANNYTYSHPTGDGNLHVPANGTTNNTKVVKATAVAGTIQWGVVNASEVVNTPSGTIVATNVQTALNELDTDKVPTSDVVTTATANKILKLNGSGVLPASITGSSASCTGNSATATTAGTCTGNAGTATKLLNTRTINGISFDGTANIIVPLNSREDNIINGLDISVGTGLQASVSEGKVVINENQIDFDTFTNTITLPARIVSLIYATANKTVGKVDAILPVADANTVARWVIDGSATIANSAVGNGLAVTNSLTKAGTVTQVDGWVGYGGKGNGTTGGYASANTTGFPLGSADRGLTILYTHKQTGAIQIIFGYGGSGVGQGCYIYVTASGNLSWADNSTPYDTGFTLENGKTYIIEYGVTSLMAYTYVNGFLVHTYPAVWATTTGVTFALKGHTTYFSAGTLHYAELRNKMRTTAQIAQIANKLCFPCSCQTYTATYPALDSALVEYKFTESSGATIANTGSSATSATASGTTIVPNRNNLGYARKFVSATDKINCGTITNLPIGASPRTFEMQLYYSTLPVGQWLFGCGSDSTALNVGFTTNGNLVLNSNYGPQVYGTKPVVLVGKPFVLHLTFDGENCNVYRDGGLVDTIPWTVLNNSGQFYINSAGDGVGAGWTNWELGAFRIFSSILPSVTMKRRASSMIGTVANLDITSILPADTMSLGMVRTNGTQIIELDSHSYKYGRREGFIKGNRRVFTGWKYFGGAGYVSFENPLGTENISCEIWYKKNLSDQKHSILGDTIYADRQYGSTLNQVSPDVVVVNIGVVPVWSPTSYTRADEYTGYVGVWMEVKE